ncbi:MAG: family 43 glycosylhydrolase [Armatimonadetes bacterium]|nr:family 43 glycosylhydrolase [Armatimonadota bacterium]
MKRLALTFVLLTIIALIPISEALAVSWNGQRAGNPVLPGYFADPCCRKFGDTYYLYVTPDGWGVGEGPFVIWTSKDFVHWTSNASNWPTTNQKWAPSVVYANSKYYMYTQVPCQVWVGTSSSPLGPWTNPISGGGCLIPDQTPAGTITLDGECFIDTDGQAYLWYGCWWTPTVVRLNADLISTVPGSEIQYFTHTGYTPPNGTVTGCMEAPYVFKRNGIYYLMYSNNMCQNSTYRVEYSTSTSPTGPWTYGVNNPILSTNADNTVDGPGHHTMMEDGGKVYIIYHRHDNPHNPSGASRQTAIDELKFNGDGSIQKLEPTHSGVGYLAPSTKKDTNLALGKTTTASSYAGADYIPAYAADENNGTLWKASSYTYPQWLQVDLGQTYTIKRVETQFEFAQVAYKYTIQYSTNGTTWSTFANRSTNTTSGSPMIDSGNVSARYVKITLTGDNYASRPSPQIGIWNFNVYDGVDKINQAPVVEAGASRTGSTSFMTIPISGNVLDDGLPNGPVTYAWSKVSGIGTVTFGNANMLDTTAAFTSGGTYVLQLLANDGALSSFDTVTYTITTPGNKLISYSFDEPSGTLVTDTSNNIRDGLFGSDGDVKDNPKRGSGIIGSSVNFDGINDYVSVPALGTCTSMSIAAWVKLDSRPDYGAILSTNGSATGAPQLLIRSTGEIQFSVVGCSPADKKSTFKFTDRYVGKWTHIAVTYDKTTKKVIFYIDGNAETAQTYTTAQTLTMAAGARVGAWNGGGRYFDGKIDELNVYNKVLTAAEVTAMVSAAQSTRIGDAKKLDNGISVSLKAKPITYAPRDAGGIRSTSYFYTEEFDRSAVLRVDDGLTGMDSADVGSGATLNGVMRTSVTTGERYLELSSYPEIESGPPVYPILTTTQRIETDPVLVGMLVKVAGKVMSIATGRKSLVISDGYTKNTTITSETAIGSIISVGNIVSVIGVVSKTGTTPATATRVVLMRDIRKINPPVTPITAGLVAWYKLDETGGATASDSSGNGKNGSLINGPVWVSGKIGNALNFDGGDDHVQLPNGLMSAINDFTICAWVKLDVNNGWNRIFDFGTGNSNYMFLSPSAGGGPLRYAITTTSNGSEQIVDAPSKLATGSWQHVTVTLSGTTCRLYLNGAQVGQNTAMTLKPSGLGTTTQTWIGKSQWGDPLFDGLIDDFRIYNRALSTTEITQIYNCY